MSKQINCVFCETVKRGYSETEINGQVRRASIITETRDFVLLLDLYPVVEDHLLIISKEHVHGCLDLPEIAWLQIPEMVKSGVNMAKYYDPSITGFNLGHNSGPDAGQTVMHCHFHLFPRRKGDVKNPRGGIRNFKAPLVKY